MAVVTVVVLLTGAVRAQEQRPVPGAEQVQPQAEKPAVVAPAMIEPRTREVTQERWYTMELAGSRAGWTMMRRETDVDGNITTTNRSRLKLKRGAVEVEISMTSTFVETARGEPVRMSSEQDMGTMTVRQEWTFTAEGVELVTRQGPTVSRRTVPKPEGAWLTPAAADAYLKQRLASGAGEIVMRTVDPQLGLNAVTSTRRRADTEERDVLGRRVPVTRFTVELSHMPGVTGSEWLDPAGVMVRSEAQVGGLAVVSELVPRREATRDVPAPEMMINTFISPGGKAISDARNSTLGVFRLSVPEGELPELPNTGAQTFERLDGRTARVTVRVGGTQPAPAKDVADPAHLAATSTANHEDPRIVDLVQRALRNVGEDPAERAEAIRRFVFNHIGKKSLGVGFATASETARTREGDCTEHAVLLVAMLRGAGIPSRAATGVVYADQFEGQSRIFGYHMWAQALLTVNGTPTWVDLDAALSEEKAFDATHLTLGVSTLAEGEIGAGMTTLAPLLGRVAIEVEETK